MTTSNVMCQNIIKINRLSVQFYRHDVCMLFRIDKNVAGLKTCSTELTEVVKNKIKTVQYRVYTKHVFWMFLWREP